MSFETLTLVKNMMDERIKHDNYYSSKNNYAVFKHQGPVVQSIVSLTKSLVNDSLSPLVRLKSSVLIFFAEKMRLQKLLTFFRQKMAVFLCIICLKF